MSQKTSNQIPTEGNNISQEKFVNFSKFIKSKIEQAEVHLSNLQPKTEEEIMSMQTAMSHLDTALKIIEEEL